MKTRLFVIAFLLVFFVSCDPVTREARRMVKRAEQLIDTQPDSTARLIDSVLRMPVNFSERERMDMALLQAEALFGCKDGMHAVSAVSPIMDDDFFDNLTNLSTSPELERAAAYYAKKKLYDKAAHAALYSGFVQQHYNEKEAAMRSFKEAEQYGELANDDLTKARAEYHMGKKLLYEGMEQEALALLKKAEIGFENHFAEKAMGKNMMAACYMIGDDRESAETCLKQGLNYAEKSHSSKVKRKILNNYAVFYRQQGNYNQALACLIQMAKEPDLEVADSLFLCLNIGKVFLAEGNLDSAAIYFNHLDKLLPNANVKEETKASAFGALANFAEQQGDTQKALGYTELREEHLSKVLVQRQEKAVYRIQKQYDYENLQNVMNRKLIRKQRFITLIGIFAIVGLAALAVSQILLAKTRKQEAETKANLFHFMQQNKELAQRSEEQKKDQIYLTQKHKESERAYEDLLKEKEKQEKSAIEYGEKLSLALKKDQAVMLRLHLFLENQGDEELLKKLEKSVFGKQSHLDAMMETVDNLYPQLRKIVKQENLELDENEQLDVIMSYFNISRQDEALLFHKTTDMVDKIRNRSRKKIQSASEGTKLPKLK